MTGLIGTPRKGKRMANVLEAILRPTKMVSPAAPKISEDIIREPKMAIDAEITPGSGVGLCLTACWGKKICQQPKRHQLKISSILFDMPRGRS